MGNGKVRSDKVTLPEAVMNSPPELRRWLSCAFEIAATLPPKNVHGPAQRRFSGFLGNVLVGWAFDR